VLGELTRPVRHIIYEVLGNFEQNLLNLWVDSFPRRDLRDQILVSSAVEAGPPTPGISERWASGHLINDLLDLALC